MICVGCGRAFTADGHGERYRQSRRYCTHACYRKRPSTPPAERFWRYVAKGDGCWEWQGARNPANRYGSFGLDRERMTPAHRFSWELHFGAIPADMFVCHRCDNPPCVRPDHLFLGTPMANVRDMDRKGRRRTSPMFGERNHQSRLTTAQVREIRERRAAGETTRALGAAFGVSGVLISKIARRVAWPHVA